MKNRLLLVVYVLINWCDAQTDFICNERDLATQAWLIPAKNSPQLEIWHNPPLNYHPFRLFTDVFLDINITDSESFQMYWGANCSDVQEQHAKDQRFFSFLKSTHVFRTYNMNPFNASYVGINTNEPYSIGIKIWEINYARVTLFFGGIILFMFAHCLVRNALFYYTSGCSAGLLASVLLVAIIVYRLAPKKTIGIPILLGGWSFSGWILYYGWTNITALLTDYYQFVVAYFAIWMVGSLAYCYRRGPPTDTRSHNLMQWGIQTISCAFIYFSSQIPEISLLVIGLLLFGSYSYRILLAPFKFIFGVYNTIRSKFFPQKRRFLTEEEFEKQMRETTDCELRKLREFCRSPDANWRQITRNVRDSKKLARFADGLADHISEEESELHDYAAETLDRSEDEANFLDDDLSSEYGGWENELRNRRPNSAMVNRRVQQDQRSRLLERISATTSRLSRPQTHRVRSEGKRNSRFSSIRQPVAINDFEDEEEYIKQLQKKQKSESSRSHAREMSYMDSDDEDLQEDDLMPIQ